MNVNEIETNQLKLSYKEISPCSESAATNWTTILEKGDVPVDKRVLLDAVKAGESFNRRKPTVENVHKIDLITAVYNQKYFRPEIVRSYLRRLLINTLW